MRKNFNYSKATKLTLATGIISIVCLVFMIHALMDIYQGKEPDLRTEWIVVTVGVIVNIFFGVLTIFTTASLLTSKE